MAVHLEKAPAETIQVYDGLLAKGGTSCLTGEWELAFYDDLETLATNPHNDKLAAPSNKPQDMDCILQCTYPASPGREAIIVSKIGLTYLAEGAAHVVYKITLEGASRTTHPHLVGRLFRFRKSIPSALSCAQTVAYFHDRIEPLFPPNSLVDLKLHHVPDQYALTAKLNEALEQRERNGSRPVHRRGVYLASSSEEQHDILVTDMSPNGPNERLIEFKPKWLIQSPSAPSEARRCRTCALREMRTEHAAHTGERRSGRGHANFCPLDLLSADNDVLEEVIRSLELTTEFVRTYVSIFKEQVQPLLLRLRDLQAQNNNVGLEDFVNRQGQDFSVSMALRDCSVLIKSRRGDVGFQEVRLADLDLKSSGGGKLEKWARTERSLIEDGWYAGTENASSRGQRFCQALQAS